MTRDPVATLVDIIINLNDQLRAAALEIERLQRQPQPLREVPPVEEKEDA